MYLYQVWILPFASRRVSVFLCTEDILNIGLHSWNTRLQLTLFLHLDQARLNYLAFSTDQRTCMQLYWHTGTWLGTWTLGSVWYWRSSTINRVLSLPAQGILPLPWNMRKIILYVWSLGIHRKSLFLSQFLYRGKLSFKYLHSWLLPVSVLMVQQSCLVYRNSLKEFLSFSFRGCWNVAVYIWDVATFSGGCLLE